MYRKKEKEMQKEAGKGPYLKKILLYSYLGFKGVANTGHFLDNVQ